MKILVLDDDDNRHRGFDRILQGRQVLHAYTASQAILALENDGPFSLVCLDHDLDLVSLLKDPGCGMDVAEYLRLHLDRSKYPARVLVHSWNEPAAERMVAAIREAGIKVKAMPYKAPS